jgi:anti-anti-sigma factor
MKTADINELLADHKVEAVSTGGITELVRGTDKQLIERLTPLVRQKHVVLDLAGVERIDAAGISALITLYCEACKAGQEFSVFNAAPRVHQILGLVGLDHILLTEGLDEEPAEPPALAQTAA